MIGWLRGRVQQVMDNSCLLDVNGVGYEITLSRCALDQAIRSSEDVSFFVHTDVRETAITLYGFYSNTERELFLMLKRVKGVGSRVAITVISSLATEELLSAIGREDVTALTKIPGVGKKTAERMLVELAELVREYASSRGINAEIEVSLLSDIRMKSGDSVANDAIMALQKLGFSEERAKSAVGLAQTNFANKNPKILQDPGLLLKESLAHI